MQYVLNCADVTCSKSMSRPSGLACCEEDPRQYNQQVQMGKLPRDDRATHCTLKLAPQRLARVVVDGASKVVICLEGVFDAHQVAFIANATRPAPQAE